LKSTVKCLKQFFKSICLVLFRVQHKRM
jgi:hypothetical protein